MENEMVGSTIKCPPTPLPPPSCQSLQRDEYSLMPRRQGNEITALPPALSLFPSLPLRGRQCGSAKQGDIFFIIIIVIAQNILVWVSEAPTLLCGPRAALKFKEFPPTVHLFRLALYMILAGGEHDLIIPAVVFHPWTRIHPETPTPREEQRSLQTDLITLYRIYEYFTILPWFKHFYKINHLSFFFFFKKPNVSNQSLSRKQWHFGVSFCNL